MSLHGAAIACGVALLAIAPAPSAFAAPIVVKLSHVAAEDTPKGRAALKFKELAEKSLRGKVAVQVFPNGRLFDEDSELQALLRGDVQILAPPISKFDRYTTKLQLFDLPFLFPDIASVDRFQHTKDGRALLDAMSPQGISGLAYWHNGMKQLSSDRPQLRRPEDVKGLKFRIQPSDVLEAQFRAVGATAQRMAFGEVYQALQSGALDGQEDTWSDIYARRFYEVQRTIAVTNHGVLDYMVITSTKCWNGLPAEIRKGLRDAIDEATAYGNGIASELNERDRGRVAQAAGARIQELDQADLAAWRKAMEPVWKKFEPGIGKDLIETARQAGKQ